MRLIASLIVCVIAAMVAVSAQPTRPIFPASYSTGESVTLISSSGVEKGTGMTYYLQGANGNMTAEINNPGQSFVADFDQQVVYYIDGLRNCEYYCQLQQDTVCNSQLNGDSLCSYDYLHSSKFVGTSEINGVPVNEFSWQDMLGPVSMADHQLFTDQDAAVPVQMQASFHPFGQWAGNVTLTFSNFTAGEPGPEAFQVNQVQSCQTSDACNQAKAPHRNFLNRVMLLNRFFKKF